MITCQNLVKIYKVADLEVVALQGLDLFVDNGEMVAVVGASGSGKTTLLNILGGLDRPSAGAVVVARRDLLRLSPRALDHYRLHEVGFIWQQTARNLLPYLNAWQNVQLPMYFAGASQLERDSWTAELLQAVGLLERQRSTMTQLSGGQQQRLALAVALANRPQLLLADEPTGELDTATARDILTLLRDLNRRYGLTIVLVTHDAQLARALDRILYIRDGRAAQDRRETS